MEGMLKRLGALHVEFAQQSRGPHVTQTLDFLDCTNVLLKTCGVVCDCVAFRNQLSVKTFLLIAFKGECVHDLWCGVYRWCLEDGH